MLTTLTLPLDEPLRTLLEQTIEHHVAQQVRELLSQVPVPDLQYSCRQAAEHLALHPDTVRNYLQLPPGHPRRLRYVQCTDNARGYRICSSELLAWQRRNDCDALRQAGMDKIIKRQQALAARRAKKGQA